MGVDWKAVNLGDVIKICYGKDHKKLNDGIIPCYGSGGIMRYVDDYLNAVGKRGFDEVAITDLRPQVDTLKDNRVNQFFVFQRKSLNAFK